MSVPDTHYVNGNRLEPPFPDGLELAMFGMGCFWGAERRFWEMPGVWSTSVGYAGGHTPNPTYEEVCSGRTGHNEVVRVVFEPGGPWTTTTCSGASGRATTRPQGMRQGNDIGTQYRSGIYCASSEQEAAATASRDAFQAALSAAGCGRITTEIRAAPEYYYAEDYHQQYLAKVPWGYCGLGGTGVAFPGRRRTRLRGRSDCAGPGGNGRSGAAPAWPHAAARNGLDRDRIGGGHAGG